jgi:hypothetical protein
MLTKTASSDSLGHRETETGFKWPAISLKEQKLEDADSESEV